MHYEKTVSGIFRDRPNRFIAHVEVRGQMETVHVKNTGRCKELLVPGCTVILEDFGDRPQGKLRKTRYDLIAVYKKLEKGHPLFVQTGTDLLINMDSQAPNKVVAEWLSELPEDQKYDFIKPEYTYGKSRVDFYMEKKNSRKTEGVQKFLMEVKGCTLERNGTGFFPDAPTERGVKHLHELTEAVKQGYECCLAFVIQIPGVQKVFPNIETHPEFGDALKEAQEAGVKVLFLQCDVKEDYLKIIN